MNDNRNSNRLIDALHSNPNALNAVRIRTRITVQKRWEEIEEATAADFPLMWIWKTLKDTQALVGSYQTFCREVSRQRQRRSTLSAPTSDAPGPAQSHSSTLPPTIGDIAFPNPDLALPPADTPPSAVMPTASPLPQREKDKAPDDYYFRPKTPEERIERKAAMKARVEAREAAEAAEGNKAGEPE